MSELKHENWAGTTYGSGFMHRSLIKFLRVVDVRILYWFLYVFVVPPSMAINGRARRATRRYLRERMGYGSWRSFWGTYRNMCVFAQVVVDKFAMYAGKKFTIELDGYDNFLRLSDGESGFVQLSSHIGNYEIAGYSLVAEKKRFNALVFGGEKESVMENRSKMFNGNNIRMIPMRADMSHLFVIDRALADGEILSMPADRVFGSQKAFSLEFLGGEANFPQGPFIVAATRRVPMLFVAVMKKKAKTYHVTVRELSQPATGSTKERALKLAQAYVGELEQVLRKHPLQWYNYFDFWKQ